MHLRQEGGKKKGDKRERRVGLKGFVVATPSEKTSKTCEKRNWGGGEGRPPQGKKSFKKGDMKTSGLGI